MPIKAGTPEWITQMRIRNAARNGRRRHFRKKPHDDVERHALGSDVPAADPALAGAGSADC